MSILRREDLRLVTGQGRYSADWNLPNQLHAVFLRSDRAHAEISKLDLARALAVGCLYVVRYPGWRWRIRG